MPLEGLFRYEDGEIAELPTTEAGQIYYFGDFSDGEIQRVIGIECAIHDLGAIVHVISDLDVLEMFDHTEAYKAFSAETQVDVIPPSGNCVVDIETKAGHAASVIMQHVLPVTQSLN